jgi:hypothetical protein
MDPSTPTAQDVQQKQSSDQPVSQTQPQADTAAGGQAMPSDGSAQPGPLVQPPKQQEPKHQQISVGGIEAGAAVVEDGDEDDDDEELMVAPQETKNRAVLGQNEGEDEEEITVIAAGQPGTADVEIQPSAKEAAVVAGPEVEKVIEKVENQETPAIPKEVQDAGVTHSGPGVIVVEQQNNFGVSQMPISYPQAVVQIKKTKFKDSKHWFLGMMMYIWRKLQIDKQKGEEKSLTVESESEEV